MIFRSYSCCPLYLLCRTPAQKDAAAIRARALGFISHCEARSSHTIKIDSANEIASCLAMINDN